MLSESEHCELTFFLIYIYIIKKTPSKNLLKNDAMFQNYFQIRREIFSAKCHAISQNDIICCGRSSLTRISVSTFKIGHLLEVASVIGIIDSHCSNF